MTVLDAIKLAAPKIGLAVPSAVFAATTAREMVEMRACANEMASRIADAYDWQALTAVATITGDGSTTEFDLPDDYARQLKVADLYSSAAPGIRLLHVLGVNEWLGRRAFGIVPLSPGEWTIYGGQFHIAPAPASGVTIQFPYIRNTIVTPNAGVAKTAFSADDDSFALSERLLRLGIIWQWKADRGRAYAEDMATYEEALMNAIGDDRGSKVLTVGRRRVPVDTDIAFPGVTTP